MSHLYVRLGSDGRVKEMQGHPEKPDDWIKCLDPDVQLGDKLKADKTVDLSARPVSSNILWEWAQTFVVDNDTLPSSRWAKCVQINALNSMEVADWAEIETFWNANK